MRCARCDQIIINQSIGSNSDGEVVFGWCVMCMTLTAHCTEITLAKPNRPPGWQARSQPIDPNQRILLGVARGVATWGLILILAGLWRLSTSAPVLDGNSLGNGSAPLFIGGGLALGLMSASLYGSTLSRERRKRLLVQTITVGSGLGSLVATYVSFKMLNTSRAMPSILFLLFAILLAGIPAGTAIASHRAKRKVNVPFRVPRRPRSPSP